jgi:hypothetical protein
MYEEVCLCRSCSSPCDCCDADCINLSISGLDAPWTAASDLLDGEWKLPLLATTFNGCVHTYYRDCQIDIDDDDTHWSCLYLRVTIACAVDGGYWASLSIEVESDDPPGERSYYAKVVDVTIPDGTDVCDTEMDFSGDTGTVIVTFADDCDGGEDCNELLVPCNCAGCCWPDPAILCANVSVDPAPIECEGQFTDITEATPITLSARRVFNPGGGVTCWFAGACITGNVDGNGNPDPEVWFWGIDIIIRCIDGQLVIDSCRFVRSYGFDIPGSVPPTGRVTQVWVFNGPSDPIDCDGTITLGDFHQYVGDEFTFECDEAHDTDTSISLTFSTTECEPGSCSACANDGEPLYRRAFTCTVPPTPTEYSILGSAAASNGFKYNDICYLLGDNLWCIEDAGIVLDAGAVEFFDSCDACTACDSECVACDTCDDICPDEGSAFISLDYSIPNVECGTCEPGGPLGDDGCGRCCLAMWPDAGSHVCFNSDEATCIADGHVWYCEPGCTSGSGTNDSPCTRSPRSGSIDIPLVDATVGSMHFYVAITDVTFDVVFDCATKTYTFTITFLGRCVATGSAVGDCFGVGGLLEYELVDTTLGHTCTGSTDNSHVEITNVELNRVNTCPV